MGKKMCYIEAPTVKQLISGANDMGVQKEDVVQIVPHLNGFILIYFG